MEKTEKLKKIELKDIDFSHLLWDDLNIEQKAIVCSYLNIQYLSKQNEDYVAILYYGHIFELDYN